MGEATDYNKWRLVFEVFLFVWNLGVSGWLWLGRSHKATLKRIDEVEANFGERFSTYEQRCLVKHERITRLESQIGEMPSHDDLGRIYDRINAVSGDVREMKGTLEGTAKSVDRLHRYLLEHDRGSKS